MTTNDIRPPQTVAATVAAAISGLTALDEQAASATVGRREIEVHAWPRAVDWSDRGKVDAAHDVALSIADTTWTPSVFAYDDAEWAGSAGRYELTWADPATGVTWRVWAAIGSSETLAALAPAAVAS